MNRNKGLEGVNFKNNSPLKRYTTETIFAHLSHGTEPATLFYAKLIIKTLSNFFEFVILIDGTWPIFYIRLSELQAY